jgi:hypothetical protein
VRARGVVQGSKSFEKARAERRMAESTVGEGFEAVDEDLIECKRLRERRPRVPVCLARKPECIRCFEERAGRS